MIGNQIMEGTVRHIRDLLSRSIQDIDEAAAKAFEDGEKAFAVSIGLKFMQGKGDSIRFFAKINFVKDRLTLETPIEVGCEHQRELFKPDPREDMEVV